MYPHLLLESRSIQWCTIWYDSIGTGLGFRFVSKWRRSHTVSLMNGGKLEFALHVQVMELLLTLVMGYLGKAKGYLGLSRYLQSRVV